GQISYTRLHRVRPLARRACAELGIPYHEVSLRTAFAEFHRHNRRMAAVAARGAPPREAFTSSPSPAPAAR
ncbi:MAG TPA: hypothetical protein VN783_15885, partial [Thermoanaerobaculia bacterium]|nr:hypothetical protein [Thermoanaerobaculia bacterium]